MMQFKLFELMDQEKTFDELISLFGKLSVRKFSDNIVGVTYDYGVNSYVDILKEVKRLNIRQIIITSSLFFKVIDYCVKRDFAINEIKFIYPILSEHVDEVEDYIEMINSTTERDKENYKLQLFKELDWITLDECIDIKSISFDIQNDKGIYYKIQLYNNGVLLIDDSSIIDTINDFVKKIL